MRILVVDGQGGKMGRMLVEQLKSQLPDAYVTAVGTNSIATAAMLKGGADAAATGENPVAVCAAHADVIMGPVGIVVADAMLGEVTKRMALAVAASPAKKILLPYNKCDVLVVGTQGLTPADAVREAVSMAAELDV